MLHDVGQRLLGHPIAGEPCLRTERPGFPRLGEATTHAAVGLEAGGKVAQAVGTGELVVAQHSDCVAGLVEAGAGQVVGALDDGGQAGLDPLVEGEHPRSFELDEEARKGMGQHVVHLTRQTLAHGEPRRLRLGFPAGLELNEEALCLLVGRSQPTGEGKHPHEAAKRGEQRHPGALPGDAVDDGDGDEDREGDGDGDLTPEAPRDH